MYFCFSAWLQCTHLNVAAETNGARCNTSSSSLVGRECHFAIDGRAEAGSANTTFTFDSGQAEYFIKIQFTQMFLINKLRIMQLDSDETQISSVRMDFSDFSSEVVRFKNVTETSLPNAQNQCTSQKIHS